MTGVTMMAAMGVMMVTFGVTLFGRSCRSCNDGRLLLLLLLKHVLECSSCGSLVWLHGSSSHSLMVRLEGCCGSCLW